MKITIFGTGYVGLVSGACLAEVGHEVMCIDIDEKKIDDLKKGIIPIYEPGLKEIVLRNYKENKLHFSTNAEEGIKFATAIFSGVGTPPDKDNHNKADLKYVYQVAKTFGKYIDGYKILINKSTVPVGTGKECYKIIENEIKKRGNNNNFNIVSNPEFLKEGNAIEDFMNPDRIVCGVSNEKSKGIMKEIYTKFDNLIFTNLESSELIKYASNSFLSVKISFINEIANFAEKVGANIDDVALGIGKDPRIGEQFLKAGIGYGGSCFPKDVEALIETGKEHKSDFKIINSALEVNKKQRFVIIEKLLKLMEKSITSPLLSEVLPLTSKEEIKEKHLLEGKTISILGLAFKPDTDDIRSAPSIDIIERLLELGVDKIKLHDPIAMENIKNIFKDETKIIYCEDIYSCTENSDSLILLTERKEYLSLDFEKINSIMKGNIIIDGRNIWNEKQLSKLGFIYKSIGK